MAVKLKRDDELSDYYYSIEESNENKVKSFMKSSSFSKRYQKAIKNIEDGKFLEPVEFARQQLSEQEKHFRGKKLNSDKRVRRITIEEMIEEIDSIAENRFALEDKLSKQQYARLSDEKIDFDDVIQLLSDVILTEDDAKCVAISWVLSKKLREKDITDDVITAEQVRLLFPELDEESDVNKTAAEIIARFYNSNTESLKQKRAETHKKKVQKLKSMRYEDIEI